MKFINLTPHDITLNDGTIIPKSGMVARVSCEYSDFDECGIADMTYGDVVGLPKKVDESPNYKDSIFYIVSNIVLTALKGSRPDCVAPATGHKDCVRDEKGQIVSVPGFVWF